jgi:hypothetical protein
MFLEGAALLNLYTTFGIFSKFWKPLSRQFIFDAGLGPPPSYFLLLAQKKVTKEKGTRMSPLFRKLAA